MLHRTGWILALSLSVAGCDAVDSVVDRVAGMWRDSPQPTLEQADRTGSGRADAAQPGTDRTDDGSTDAAGPKDEARVAGSTGPAESGAERALRDGPGLEADGTVLPSGRLFTVQVAAF